MYNKDTILQKVDVLYKMWTNGNLGREVMPEDANPNLDKISNENKKKFPYLSGTKICNYWLYVIYQYTNRKYKNIEHLTVAPDTHVIQATYKLGLISGEELNRNDIQLIVVDR